MKYFNNRLLIPLFLLIISVIAMLPLILTNTLFSGIDMGFHLNRCYDLYQNLRHGNLFPYISTYSFNKLGTPINMVYGLFPCYPIAFMMLIVKNKILAVYLGIIILYWLMMLISYWVAKMFYKNMTGKEYRSIIFSIVYSLSTYIFNFYFQAFDLGQVTSTMFLPLVAYGTYSIFFEANKKWYLLTLGMTGVIYTHLISTLTYSSLICLIAIVGWYYCSDRIISLKKLILAIGTTCFTTAFYWGTLYTVISTHPSITSMIELSGQPLQEVWNNILGNTNATIGIAFFILMICSLCSWKQLLPTSKVALIFSIIYILITTNLFNAMWVVLNHTPIKAIQWPYRFISIANFLVAIFISDYLYKVVELSYLKKLMLSLIIFLTMFFFWNNSVNFVKLGTTKLSVDSSKKLPFDNYKIDSNKAFRRLVNSHYDGVGSLDYWPKNALPFHDRLIYKDKENIKAIPNGIEITINSEKNTVKNIPFLVYGNNYNISNNNEKVSLIKSDYSTIVTHCKQGKNKLRISYNPSILIVVLKWVSAISIALLVLTIVRESKDGVIKEG